MNVNLKTAAGPVEACGRFFLGWRATTALSMRGTEELLVNSANNGTDCACRNSTFYAVGRAAACFSTV